MVELFEVELEGETLEGLTEGQVNLLKTLLEHGENPRHVFRVFNKHLQKHSSKPVNPKIVLAVPKQLEVIKSSGLRYKWGRVIYN